MDDADRSSIKRLPPPPIVAPAATAFFLDVDGTLLGFKSRPEHVVADAELIARLTTLRHVADGALALVSGRMITDLDRIVMPLVLPAAGVHGADIRFADGCRRSVGETAMTSVRLPVGQFVAQNDGVMLEDKGATLALHYRHAPERVDEIRRFLQQLRLDHDIAVQEGKFVMELKSDQSDKGTAIAALMETAPFKGRKPLFIGDDLTDEHGFRAVNAMDGLSILVGDTSRKTLANFSVSDPSAVGTFLTDVCRSDGRS